MIVAYRSLREHVGPCFTVIYHDSSIYHILLHSAPAQIMAFNNHSRYPLHHIQRNSLRTLSEHSSDHIR